MTMQLGGQIADEGVTRNVFLNSIEAPSDRSLREYLKSTTRARHDLLDAAWQDASFADAATYASFLTAQLAARLPIERWAEKHAPEALRPPQVTTSLIQDLILLGVPYSLRPAPLSMPADAAPIGAAWAIAGSHMGNRAILARMRWLHLNASIAAPQLLGRT